MARLVKEVVGQIRRRPWSKIPILSSSLVQEGPEDTDKVQRLLGLSEVVVVDDLKA